MPALATDWSKHFKLLLQNYCMWKYQTCRKCSLYWSSRSIVASQSVWISNIYTPLQIGRWYIFLFQKNCILTLPKYSFRNPQLVVNEKTQCPIFILHNCVDNLPIICIEKILFQLNHEITSLCEQRKITIIEIFDYLLKRLW